MKMPIVKKLCGMLPLGNTMIITFDHYGFPLKMLFEFKQDPFTNQLVISRANWGAGGYRGGGGKCCGLWEECEAYLKHWLDEYSGGYTRP